MRSSRHGGEDCPLRYLGLIEHPTCTVPHRAGAAAYLPHRDVPLAAVGLELNWKKKRKKKRTKSVRKRANRAGAAPPRPAPRSRVLPPRRPHLAAASTSCPLSPSRGRAPAPRQPREPAAPAGRRRRPPAPASTPAWRRRCGAAPGPPAARQAPLGPARPR